MGAEIEFTNKEVAAHRERNDCWMTIRGEGKSKWVEKEGGIIRDSDPQE